MCQTWPGTGDTAVSRADRHSHPLKLKVQWADGQQSSQQHDKAMPACDGAGRGPLFLLVLALTTLRSCLELLCIHLFTVCLCGSNVTS